MRGELVKPDNRIEYNTGPRMRIAGAAIFVVRAADLYRLLRQRFLRAKKEPPTVPWAARRRAR